MPTPPDAPREGVRMFLSPLSFLACVHVLTIHRTAIIATTLQKTQAL